MSAERKKPPYFKANTKAHEIIRLWRDGVRSPSEISRRVGCTVPNTVKTLARHVPEYTPHKKPRVVRVVGLPKDDMRWLESEAKANGVEIDQMARAMLVDAIEEARNR
jgi:hypothetical protein